MKIVITGSEGFLGRVICHKLSRKDFQIIKLDKKLNYDLTKPASLSGISDFDVLIHLASLSFVPDSFENPSSFYHTNITSTLNAIDLCRKFSAKFIFISSYLYGNPEYLPIDEKHPLKPHNPYAQSKIISENICMAYFRDFGVQYTIFRPFNIFGPGQNHNFLIPQIIQQASRKKIILKDPNPKRDFIFVDDVADAVIRSIKHEPSNQRIFNLGYGKSISVNEIANLIQKYCDYNLNITYTHESRKNEVMDTVANIEKARELLDWYPKISVDHGLKTIVEKYL